MDSQMRKIHNELRLEARHILSRIEPMQAANPVRLFVVDHSNTDNNGQISIEPIADPHEYLDTNSRYLRSINFKDLRMAVSKAEAEDSYFIIEWSNPLYAYEYSYQTEEELTNIAQLEEA